MNASLFAMSPHFRLLEQEEVEAVDWVHEVIAEGKWESVPMVLCRLKDDGWYLINPMIKAFLEAFEKPISLNDVVIDFAKKAGCAPTEIETTMQQFLDDMINRKIIVDEILYQKLLEDNVRENFFQEGELLQGYQLIELIAKKSRAEIWKGKDLKNGQPVAIKLVKFPKKISDAERKNWAKKFFQEFILIEEIHEHPLVCRSLDRLEAEEYVAGVLEYVEGISIKRFLRHNELSFFDKMHLFQQILKVMAHVHQKGILHGDLHSSNFLIKADKTIKLIDFNLSNHAVPQDWEIVRKGGVQQYIPPEKISTNALKVTGKRADFRSEVYQVGVMAFLLFYEKLPFEGLTYKDLVEVIQKQKPDFQLVTPSGEPMPPHLLLLLKKALQKNPANRFESAQAMYLAFENTLLEI